MSTEKSIGVFDSGLGGLTVLAALRKKFPYESIIYLGDTARLPYGTKSPETVIKYALNCAKALMQKADLKLLVIACNTATAHALKTLQECLPIPVIGVIEPGVLEVLAHPEIKSVAVLATPGTISVGAYEKALRKHGFLGEINSLACPLFVPLVEEGLVSGPIAENIARDSLDHLPK
ncbi:MAG: glutamate racemase, partial [Myxococcaceae bacterium]